jgi:site-specific recombinase XerD
MLKLIYEYGLSRSEILGLKISDFARNRNANSSELKYQITVTFKNKIRTLDVSEEIGMMFERQILIVPNGNPFIFFGTKEGPLVQDIINQLLEKYSVIGGLTRIINPQAIKSAYIRNLFDNGLSVKEVSEITGMSKHNFYTVYKKIVNPETRWNDVSDVDLLKDDLEDEYEQQNQERLSELENILNDMQD